MDANSRAVTVTTDPTRLDDPSLVPGLLVGVSLYNAGAARVSIGGADVTTSNGYPLDPGEHLPLDTDNRAHVSATGSGSVFGVVASGEVEVRVLQVGN